MDDNSTKYCSKYDLLKMNTTNTIEQKQLYRKQVELLNSRLAFISVFMKDFLTEGKFYSGLITRFFIISLHYILSWPQKSVFYFLMLNAECFRQLYQVSVSLSKEDIKGINKDINGK